MKELIFDLVIVIMLLLNSNKLVIGQEGQTNLNGKGRTAMDISSRLGIGRTPRLYIMSNIDKNLQFRRSRFSLDESQANFAGTAQWSDHRNIGNLSTSADNGISDLQFGLDPEMTVNKLELVRKIDPQLYQLNLKALTPSPYTQKNDFKIAEQLLLILLQENQRKSHR